MAKQQQWTSSTDLENFVNKQRLLWKSPAEKENYEQRTGDACEEEEGEGDEP